MQDAAYRGTVRSKVARCDVSGMVDCDLHWQGKPTYCKRFCSDSSAKRGFRCKAFPDCGASGHSKQGDIACSCLSLAVYDCWPDIFEMSSAPCCRTSQSLMALKCQWTLAPKPLADELRIFGLSYSALGFAALGCLRPRFSAPQLIEMGFTQSTSSSYNVGMMVGIA